MNDDLTQRRKQRLRALIEGKPFFGNQSAFAQKAGLTKGRINQLIDPSHSFGERAGVSLARALGFADERYFEKGDSTAPDTPRSISGLADALEVITNALLEADQATRLAVEPLLASIAKEPRDSVKNSHLILRLLVTEGASPQRPEDVSRPAKLGTLIGGSAIRDIGGLQDGRSNRDAASGGKK